ncbi:CotG/ExsB N-terminal domain-containing protein [Heyndrickxia ginsengihumi]|uniref:CotG/ExsB N-terminal domain-containing protein n=1 Tax=Heyndrickxia ginsengihumi TaxID=363870 RepID=UPI003D197812
MGYYSYEDIQSGVDQVHLNGLEEFLYQDPGRKKHHHDTSDHCSCYCSCEESSDVESSSSRNRRSSSRSRRSSSRNRRSSSRNRRSSSRNLSTSRSCNRRTSRTNQNLNSKHNCNYSKYRTVKKEWRNGNLWSVHYKK